MNRLFKTAYLLGIVAQIAIRLPHERRRRQTQIDVDRVSPLERRLVGSLFLGGFLIPAVYIFSPWLRRADYRLTPATKQRAGSLGVVLLASALWVFWRSHRDLGQNWSPSLQIRHEHTLVTRGIYQHVRHPMYLSQFIWVLAQSLLLQNWVAGWAGLLTFLPLYLTRVPQEEQLMLEEFGDDYRQYMQRTGRVLPRLKS